MYEKERRALIDCALQMKECRLITLCGGNVCMRLDNGNIAVTPSGMDYEIMTSDDVVIVTPQGKIVEGTRRPTSDLDAILYILKNSPGSMPPFTPTSPTPRRWAWCRTCSLPRWCPRSTPCGVMCRWRPLRRPPTRGWAF